MDDRVIWASGHGILLLAVLGGIAFASGFWGVLIVLAPSAYLLVLFPHKQENSPRTVVVSHLIALIIGWVAYSVLAHGIAPTSIEPMSESGLRIVWSALVAFIASTAIFYELHLDHPMAYVTTFTAAIGAFPTIQALTVVVGTIFLVGGIQVSRRKLGPDKDSDSGPFTDLNVRS